MSDQPPRSYTRIAAVMVVAAVIVAAAIVATSTFGATMTITKTIPETTTSISITALTVTSTVTATPTGIPMPTTETTTTTVTTISTRTLGNTTVIVTGTLTFPAGAHLYEVIFKQSGDCTPTSYAAPWSVTLGPWTVVEPSNAAFPVSTGSGTAGPSYANSSVIAFSVPNGNYQYSMAVAWNFGNPSGVVNVNGNDVTVVLQGPLISCTSTSTATA